MCMYHKLFDASGCLQTPRVALWLARSAVLLKLLLGFLLGSGRLRPTVPGYHAVLGATALCNVQFAMHQHY